MGTLKNDSPKKSEPFYLMLRKAKIHRGPQNDDIECSQEPVHTKKEAPVHQRLANINISPRSSHSISNSPRQSHFTHSSYPTLDQTRDSTLKPVESKPTNHKRSSESSEPEGKRKKTIETEISTPLQNALDDDILNFDYFYNQQKQETKPEEDKEQSEDSPIQDSPFTLVMTQYNQSQTKSVNCTIASLTQRKLILLNTIQRARHLHLFRLNKKI